MYDYAFEYWSVKTMGTENLVTLDDKNKDYILDLMKSSEKIKEKGSERKVLDGKHIAILFEKPSTRTRSAFEIAVKNLGGSTTFFGKEDIHLGKKESIRDNSKVMERYFDGIGYRGYEQSNLEKMDKQLSIPVVNLLTDFCHPTQALADIFTIYENFDEDFTELELAYIGNGKNNVLNSLLICSAITGLDLNVVTPEEFKPNSKVFEKAKNISQKTKSDIKHFNDKKKGLKNVDAVYTDVWVSMGDSKDEWGNKIEKLGEYSVDRDIMSLTASDSIFMHCLPAFHNRKTDIGREICDEHNLDYLEVSDDVFNSERSVVFEQAENKLYTLEALLKKLFK